jgi:drug/metabolite transporter (DMT)-like permease
MNNFQDTPLWKARLALVGGVLALTLSPLFFRWAEAPGIVTSFYRMFYTTLLLLPLALRKKAGSANWDWKYLIFPVIGGLASSLDHSFWGSSINLTTVANATLLNNASPLWVALFSWLILKEKLTRSFWLGLVLVLAGATLVLGSTFFSRPAFLIGDILALISSLFYGIFFLATAKGRTVLRTSVYLLVMSITAGIGLLIATRLFGYPLTGYSLHTNLTFLAAAIISQFGAYYLISYSLGRLSASVVTPSMVAQPVLTALLAIPLMGEPLLVSQSLGGILTLGGIYLINRGSPAGPGIEPELVRE